MRRGAVDFLTKPRRRREAPLLDRPRRRKKLRGSGRGRNSPRTCGPLAALSPRECQVAQLAAEGLTTKAVSDVLGIAELHRTGPRRPRRSKLGVENAVGVAQIIARLRARGVLQ